MTSAKPLKGECNIDLAGFSVDLGQVSPLLMKAAGKAVAQILAATPPTLALWPSDEGVITLTLPFDYQGTIYRVALSDLVTEMIECGAVGDMWECSIQIAKLFRELANKLEAEANIAKADDLSPNK